MVTCLAKVESFGKKQGEIRTKSAMVKILKENEQVAGKMAC